MFNIDKLHPTAKEFLLKMHARHNQKDWYHYHVNGTWY